MSFELMNRFHHIEENYCVQDELSVSSYMKYIPIYAISMYHQRNDFSFSVNLPENEFIYSKLKPVTNERISRYTDLFSMLNGFRSTRSIAYQYKYNDEEYNTFASHGILTDEIGSILLVLTIHKDQFFDFYNEIINDVKDYSKLKLFVSKELFTNPKYSLLWRKVEKEYYYNAIAEGVDVEILSSDVIHSFIYSDGLDVNFSSITEFQNHVNNEVYDDFIQFVTDSENYRIEQERLEAEREEQILAELRERRRLERIERSKQRIERFVNIILNNYNTNLVREHLIMFFNYQLENNSHLSLGLDSIYLDNPDNGTFIIWNDLTENEFINFDEYKQTMLDQFNIIIDDYIPDVNDIPGFVIVDEEETSNENEVETQEEAPEDSPF